MEEVKCAVTAALMLLLPFSCFCELVDPKPLKVPRVCGVAIAAGAKIQLKDFKERKVLFERIADEKGKFDFGPVSTGLYRITGLLWTSKSGELVGPLENAYPLRVTGSSKASSCKHPLLVSILTGSESGLNVSFLGESKQ